MTHVLLVTDRFLRAERTGLDRYCDEMAYWLPRLVPGVEFTLASFGEQSVRHEWFADNIKHVGLPVSRRNFMLSALLRFNNPLGELIDAVDLVHTLIPLPVVSRKPLLVTVHDVVPLLFPQYYPWHNRFVVRWMLGRLARQNSRFIAVSKCTRDDLARLMKIPSARITTIYNGVNPAYWSQDREGIGQARAKYHLPDRYFLYIGSMHPRKNLKTLLSAYLAFKPQDVHDVGLVLAGRMGLGGDALVQYLQDQQIQDAVTLPGYIAEADLPDVIRGSEAVIYPSLYEGFGLPALEAIACGTPVIASQSSSIPEATGENAHLCDPLDVSCFVDAMRSVVEHPEMREELSVTGPEWASRFSWKETAAGVLGLYASLVKGFPVAVEPG